MNRLLAVMIGALLLSLMIGAGPTSVKADGPFPEIPTMTFGNTAAASTHIIALPSGSPGYYLVCITFAGGALTWPAGWGVLFSQGNGVDSSLECGITFSNAAITPTVSVAQAAITQTEYHVVYYITGAAGFQITTAASGTGSANPNPPSLTAVSSANRLWVSVYEWGSSRTHASYPASYDLNQMNTGDATTKKIAIAARQLAAQTEDPGTATVSGTAGWAANTISFLPETPAAQADLTHPTSMETALILLLLLAEFVLFALSLRTSAAFAVLSGVFGVFLSMKLFDLTGDYIIAGAWATISIVLLLVGATANRD